MFWTYNILTVGRSAMPTIILDGRIAIRNPRSMTPTGICSVPIAMQQTASRVKWMACSVEDVTKHLCVKGTGNRIQRAEIHN
ncbi:unnamed protein product [Sphenostylis stenocarpa]|uniref:Uncharacterized protein n=1 Tax=Sphenostylis stenocarpa TaxID=92480 RepID=A0AA86S442_9FABA|nr:unnamed protein product [Sphenostylis stenocarpa]